VAKEIVAKKYRQKIPSKNIIEKCRQKNIAKKYPPPHNRTHNRTIATPHVWFSYGFLMVHVPQAFDGSGVHGWIDAFGAFPAGFFFLFLYPNDLRLQPLDLPRVVHGHGV
jgi:hypothetical protein